MVIGKRQQQQHHLLLKMIHIHPIKKMSDATSSKQNQPQKIKPLAGFLLPSRNRDTGDNYHFIWLCLVFVVLSLFAFLFVATLLDPCGFALQSSNSSIAFIVVAFIVAVVVVVVVGG